jgi:hypothetical protein
MRHITEEFQTQLMSTNHLEPQVQFTQYIKIQFLPYRKQTASPLQTPTVFKEIIYVYCENHTKHTSTVWTKFRGFNTLNNCIAKHKHIKENAPRNSFYILRQQ